MNIYQMRPLTLSLRNRGICNSEISLGELYCVCVVIHVNLVESRGGAVPLGSCGTTIAFALILSRLPYIVSAPCSPNRAYGFPALGSPGGSYGSHSGHPISVLMFLQQKCTYLLTSWLPHCVLFSLIKPKQLRLLTFPSLMYVQTLNALTLSDL